METVSVGFQVTFESSKVAGQKAKQKAKQKARPKARHEAGQKAMQEALAKGSGMAHFDRPTGPHPVPAGTQQLNGQWHWQEGHWCGFS